MIAGNGTTACPLVAPASRRQLAKADDQSSCETVVETAAELLKSRPTQAAEPRSYPSTVEVTLYGDTVRRTTLCLLISEDRARSKRLAVCCYARASDSLHVDGIKTAGRRPR